MCNRQIRRLLGCLLPCLLAWPTLAAAPAPENRFHFSILGDRTGGATPEVYERVWREIALLGPDFVINVGDTIEGHNDAAAPWQWAEVARVWSRYMEFPLYLIPGNHDVWDENSQRLYQKVTGRALTYSFDYQNAHFTVLDNSRTLNLAEDQLKFLETDLAKNRQRAPKFVFFHQPVWLIPLKLGSGEFPLHQLARKYGVNYVISGHGHLLIRLERDGVTYLEVGSSGAGAMRGRESNERFARGQFYHHVWVRVKGAKAYFTVKELDGPCGKGRMFPAEDWGPDGPKFDPADPAQLELSRPGP
jgi:3',5'-cyclic AMP phosphodiesterase CpdA